MSIADAGPQAVAEATTKPRGEKLFDRTAIIPGFVPHPDFPDGKKRCIVRFPTDKEWCQRAHKLVSVRKAADGDGMRTETPHEQAANLDLFNAIRQDPDGPAFDEAEATKIIQKLEQCIVTDTQREGVNYRITMKAFNGAIVTHTLKIPTQKQLMDYGRAAVDIVGRKKAVETRVALEPCAILWDGVMQWINGYKQEGDSMSCVPITHMDVATNELVARINQDFEDTDPED